MVKVFYRVESFVIFLFAVFIYSTFEVPFWTLAVFFMVPDISMAGYLISKKTGAFYYNFGHNYALGLGLTLIGMVTDGSPIGIIPDGAYLSFAGVIIIAHTAFDRMAGFGLKYPADFKETHVQKI